jgi:RNA polymerase sigma factor (sigma-70 family)
MVHSTRNRVLCLLANASGERPDQSDSYLLQRFVGERDESAFEVLLRRHGGMVWGVCRRSLEHEQDAEDVFQATFLLLAQQASRIRKPEALASWLHGAALRLAQRAKRDLARRHNHERRALRPASSVAGSDPALYELQELLDTEVDRLPAKYRDVFTRCVLCGQSKQEIATALGCDLGTVAVHLCRARKRLQQQLARRGMAYPAALTAAALTTTAATAAPAKLIVAALQVVRDPLSLPERIAGLVLHGSSAVIGSAKPKIMGIVLLVVTLLAAGAWAITPLRQDQREQASSPQQEQPRPDEVSVAAREDKPEKPPTYIIRLVKTDLQRELAPMRTDVFVLVDATPALADGKIVKSKLNLDEMRKALKQYMKADAKLHVTLFFDRLDQDERDNRELLRLAMIGFGHWIGFSKVTAWETFTQGKQGWEETTAPFTSTKAEPEGEERVTSNKLAKAYPVRSALSRHLTGGADCAVLILPSLAKEGGTIPQKVRDGVSDAVGKLKLTHKKRVSFIVSFVGGKEQQMLLDALDRFAKDLGFEQSVVTFR